MKRIHDPARLARERMLRLEAQGRVRAEARAVAEGVAETVALSRARGSAVAEPPKAQRRVRAQPYRKLSGLEWLEKKGRLNPQQRAAGERYGQAYRRAKAETGLGSSWNAQPDAGPPVGRPLSEILAHGEGTARAQAALAALRGRLLHQRDLVAACDLICGEEKTPREAASDREALRLEAVLQVALDLLKA